MFKKVISIWDIRKLDICKLLEENKFEQLKKYTIFNAEHVHRSAKEFKQLHEIYSKVAKKSESFQSKPPKKLVVFRFERLVLHELIVCISTNYAIPSEKAMRQLIDKAYPAILKDQKIKELILKAHEFRSNMEKEVLNCIQSKKTTLDSKIQIRIKEFYKLCNEEGITTTIFADELYSLWAEKTLMKPVETITKECLKTSGVKEISIPDPAQRVTFMVSGGQSSGKGSTIVLLKKYYENFATKVKLKQTWNDFVKVNTDSYKPIILKYDKTHGFCYSQYAQEEASLIHVKVFERLKKLQGDKKAPHVLIDQVFVGEDKLTFAVKDKGVIVYVAVVALELNKAIVRSKLRGEKSNRYEDIDGILRCHKYMTQEVPKSICKFVGKPVLVKLYDNNDVKLGEEPELIMEIDLKDKSFSIVKEQKVSRFIQKVNIDLQKSIKEKKVNKSSEEEVTIEKYFKPLSDAGVDILITKNLSIHKKNKF